MTKFAKIASAAALVLGFIASPVLASGLTPVGTWQLTSGEARFEVEMCGDGTQLCATLVWLREDARTPENLAFLNKMVVQGAERQSQIKWVGNVTYEGETYSGNVSLVNAETLRMAGCKGIACESMLFNRV